MVYPLILSIFARYFLDECLSPVYLGFGEISFNPHCPYTSEIASEFQRFPLNDCFFSVEVKPFHYFFKDHPAHLNNYFVTFFTADVTISEL